MESALQIGGTVVVTLLGVIGYFLRDIRSDIKENLKAQDKKIEKIAADLADFKAQLPMKYVIRDDFLRAIANQDYKLDMLGKELGKVSENLNKLIGGKARETT